MLNRYQLEREGMDHRIVRSIIGGLREVDRSGYELWRWIGSVHGHGEELTEANLYPTLHRLEAERLIIGKWQDTYPARRVYRIAARGSDMALKRGWPALVRRAAPALPSVEPAGGQDAASAEEPPPAGNIDEYLDRLGAGLRLCEPERRSVRSEIEDHLRDVAAELRKEGFDESKADATAMSRLGPPEALAESISRSQLTLRRLLAGIPPAAYTAVVAAGLGTAAGAGCLLVVQPAMRGLTSAALLANVHLYVPETGEWHDQQLVAALWAGAFMAGRMSLRRLANETRRHEAAISRWWMLGAGLLLLAVVMLYPMLLDPATAIGLLGVPVAFVTGCQRYQKIGDDPVSRQGLAAAAAILLLFVLMPGVRTWIFDPGPGTQGPAPELTSGVDVSWSHSGGYWLARVEGVDPALWRDVQIELWPAARQGPFVVPDPTAAEPVLIAGPNRTGLPNVDDPPADYWVAVTAVGNDGQRRTIHAEVHQSDRAGYTGQLLGWLLGDR
jgi:DNA-binding PadR family transcriptional regulator